MDANQAAIAREKKHSLAVARPARAASATILFSGELMTIGARRIDNPNMRVFRYAVDGGDIPLCGCVGNQFSIRRPCRFVLAAGSVGDLAHLSL